MMALRLLPLYLVALLLNVSAFAQTAPEPQDPPGRVGRLSDVEGTVQQRTADSPNWAAATLNFPVSNGFALAAQPGGRAEIEVGTFVIRVGGNSEIDIDTLDDKNAVLTVAQGEISLGVRSLGSDEHLQVVTPRGIVDLTQPGQYHFNAGTTVDPTEVGTLAGAARIEHATAPIDVPPGQTAMITGDGSAPGDVTLTPAVPDPLDQWAAARDQPRPPIAPPPSGGPVTQLPPSVPSYIPGAGDLAQYGSYSSDPQYGTVWYPSAVPVGWAPYAFGHWVWISPWGWTWIDDAPWGFAPFHYGRWIHGPRGWGWAPGIFVGPPVFAPALVVFIGTPSFGVILANHRPGVAWFPLGPREVFVPSYRTSVEYVRSVNRSSVVNINQINITRVHETIVIDNNVNGTTANFVNRGAATVVPAEAFARGEAVHRVAVPAPAGITAGAVPTAHEPAAVPPRPIAAASLPHPVVPGGTEGAPRELPTLVHPHTPPAGGGQPESGSGGAQPSATHGGRPLPPLPGSGTGSSTAAGAVPTPGTTRESRHPVAPVAVTPPEPEKHERPQGPASPTTPHPTVAPNPAPPSHPAPATVAPKPEPHPQPHPTPVSTPPKGSDKDKDKDKKEQ
ncbi:MAG TPA: DUF6600 domain-containing protein [Stellaceae bacterium]|nr:DUF6600 domain-containing protein [Stellaceae bacterium]